MTRETALEDEASMYAGGGSRESARDGERGVLRAKTTMFVRGVEDEDVDVAGARVEECRGH